MPRPLSLTLPASGPEVRRVDYEVAERLVRRGRELGAERGVVVTVAVVDAAGHPVALARGKNWHGPYMAFGKARLAAAFRKPTDVLLEGWADRPLFAESLTSVLPGGVTLNPGGHPVVRDGECIGAVGIGGGPPELDAEIARLTAEPEPPDDPGASAGPAGRDTPSVPSGPAELGEPGGPDDGSAGEAT